MPKAPYICHVKATLNKPKARWEWMASVSCRRNGEPLFRATEPLCNRARLVRLAKRLFNADLFEFIVDKQPPRWRG
jgi:hypothetical protein